MSTKMHMCHVCYTYGGYMSHMYVSHMKSDINHVTWNTEYIQCKLHFILLALYMTEKYDCHIVHEHHTALILYGQIGPNATNCSTYLIQYWHVCAINKYGYHTAIHPIYVQYLTGDVWLYMCLYGNGINHATRNTVHRKRWQRCQHQRHLLTAQSLLSFRRPLSFLTIFICWGGMLNRMENIIIQVNFLFLL